MLVESTQIYFFSGQFGLGFVHSKKFKTNKHWNTANINKTWENMKNKNYGKL